MLASTIQFSNNNPHSPHTTPQTRAAQATRGQIHRDCCPRTQQRTTNGPSPHPGTGSFPAPRREAGRRTRPSTRANRPGHPIDVPPTSTRRRTSACAAGSPCPRRPRGKRAPAQGKGAP
jgi:hypothetical protein